MEKLTLKIGGMTCVNCQNRIEKTLKSMAGVSDVSVSYAKGTAAAVYDSGIVTYGLIVSAIEALDYRVLDTPGAGLDGQKTPGMDAVAQIAIIIAAYMLLKHLGVSSLTSAFPLAEEGMGYGMLFIVGLITSVHCVAMCGGINLSQTLNKGGEASPLSAGFASNAANPALPPSTGGAPRNAPHKAVPHRFATLLPALLYNAGRVVSYTTVGAVVGALGSVVTVGGRFKGLVQLAAGVFMIIMGVNMLGIFPWLRRFNLAMPRIFARKIDAQKAANKSPLIIGLLNGLMPCGPLQAMQLYALSTGSPLRGAAAMLIFSLGTVPLMFILGAAGSLLSGTARGRSFSSRVMKAGAILVAVMGLAMFTNGWSLGGFPRPVDALASLVRPASSPGPAAGETFAPEIADGVQVINSTLSPNRYPAIVVRRGIPVKWVITAAAGSINGCNNRMIIREYGIEHSFTQGENIIEFMPEREGRFSYSCWMGMIRSSITVAAEDAVVADADAATSVATAKPEIIPAGVTIPTDEVAFAELATRETINYGRKYQVVNINLRDDGFSPSVIVLEKDIPTIWTINNDSLEPGNAELIFPAYFTTIPMQDGDNQIELLPRSDFDFSTADNVYYGYVKVVDSIAAVDLSAVRNEVANWETQVYPPEYFEQSSNEQSQSEQSSRASCCQ